MASLRLKASATRTTTQRGGDMDRLPSFIENPWRGVFTNPASVENPLVPEPGVKQPGFATCDAEWLVVNKAAAYRADPPTYHFAGPNSNTYPSVIVRGVLNVPP